MEVAITHMSHNAALQAHLVTQLLCVSDALGEVREGHCRIGNEIGAARIRIDDCPVEVMPGLPLLCSLLPCTCDVDGGCPCITHQLLRQADLVLNGRLCRGVKLKEESRALLVVAPPVAIDAAHAQFIY